MPTYRASRFAGSTETRCGFGRTACWKRHAGEHTTDGIAALSSYHREAARVTSLMVRFKMR